MVYLHQKVATAIESYKLSHYCKEYNDLVAKRDTLLYNSYKDVCLAKLNTWAIHHSLKPAKKEDILALYINVDTTAGEQKATPRVIARSKKFLFGLPGEERVLAEEKSKP